MFLCSVIFNIRNMAFELSWKRLAKTSKKEIICNEFDCKH